MSSSDPLRPHGEKSKYPKAPIYTKTGDQGHTRLVSGTIVTKYDSRVEAYGSVDELNSHLGLARAMLPKKARQGSGTRKTEKQVIRTELDRVLQKIQNDLFNLGSLLACDSQEVAVQLPRLKIEDLGVLEFEIDRMHSHLPKLTQFLLPSGTLLCSQLHIARTVCRRAERRCALVISESCHETSGSLDGQESERELGLELKYLNRLSDYLFTAARYVQFRAGQNEILWQK